jgi:hypothetical protein
VKLKSLNFYSLNILLRRNDKLYLREIPLSGVMMIDFERASILEPPRHPLAQVVPSKRNWRPETVSDSKPDKSSKRREVARAFTDEISMVGFIFGERYIY